MSPCADVLVIGAGLAGASTAFELAQRGLSVRILEAALQPAALTSGNPAGIFMPVVEREPSPRERLFLEAFEHLMHLLDGPLAGVRHQRCGVIQLPRDARQAERFRTILETRTDLSGILAPGRDLLPEAARAHAGGEAALHFSSAGWLTPPDLCRHMLARPGIELRTGCAVEAGTLRRTARGWQIADGTGRTHEAPHLVLAAGSATARFAPVAALPWHLVRGQVERIALDDDPGLDRVLCGQGYFIPLPEGGALIGATYRRDTFHLRPDPQETRENLDRLRELMPELAEATPRILESRVGIRCVLPGRLPAVGAVPNQPGLWLNAGHASRGILTAPFGASLLADGILGRQEPPAYAHLLDPARFMPGHPH